MYVLLWNIKLTHDHQMTYPNTNLPTSMRMKLSKIPPKAKISCRNGNTSTRRYLTHLKLLLHVTHKVSIHLSIHP